MNADARGAGNSEGRLVLWGKQDGEDGHDAIECIAAQPWSNGKVGMFAAGRNPDPDGLYLRLCTKEPHGLDISRVEFDSPWVTTEPAVPSLDGGN